MDLVVNDQEISQATLEVAQAANALVQLGGTYVACMRGVIACGYSSDAVGDAVEERCARVSGAVSSFSEAVAPLCGAVTAYLQDIASIDTLV